MLHVLGTMKSTMITMHVSTECLEDGEYTAKQGISRRKTGPIEVLSPGVQQNTTHFVSIPDENGLRSLVTAKAP
eukprot:6042143-Amphidinium_carterae.1